MTDGVRVVTLFEGGNEAWDPTVPIDATSRRPSSAALEMVRSMGRIETAWYWPPGRAPLRRRPMPQCEGDRMTIVTHFKGDGGPRDPATPIRGDDRLVPGAVSDTVRDNGPERDEVVLAGGVCDTATPANAQKGPVSEGRYTFHPWKVHVSPPSPPSETRFQRCTSVYTDLGGPGGVWSAQRRHRTGGPGLLLFFLFGYRRLLLPESIFFNLSRRDYVTDSS